MTTLRHLRSRRGGRLAADALYGVLYPADHLRLVSLGVDPADCSRGILVFDRALAGVPGDVELWVGDRKGCNPQLAGKSTCRVDFNSIIQAGTPWSFDPAGGGFTGADGCKGALAASGIVAEGNGELPAGKVWLSGMNRSGDDMLEFIFNADVTLDTGQAAGYWATDGEGNVMYGSLVEQASSNSARVSFASNLGSPGRAGLVAGFSGVIGAEALAPVTWRI